ncbi:LytR/AlgR family response regulator transcription factor [Microbacterium ulmi]|uniref:Response regulator transcription factor n=1 Tax=Microbacterium ulmi TaxID=179095 RepID=A0A7Y2LZ28_9MICO|nr:LytTR family DNA-binding domain-containing protein [Microbacterium ulmi]NII69663.1 DNA-binding LytR/AlgR family response regulator [Microbacterium ulmi]NNH03449.1 response regulator transcription factor [Microbacterium ulmi]
MPLDVLVADDEAPALAELVAFLDRDPRIRRIRQASSGADALRILSTDAVDAAFLDIHMPGLSGFDLARALDRFVIRPIVVFVTADEAGALEAFDVRAVDYVLKPVRVARLEQAIDRVAAAVRSRDAEPLAAGEQDAAAGDETVPVSVGSSVRLVRRSDVRWVHAEGDYSRLWTTSGVSHLVRAPISELEERWSAAGFVRVHRSYLVHRDAVTEVRLSGPAPVVVLSEIELPVSRRLVPAVREQLVRPDRGPR